MPRANSKSKKICAFCKHWYDPTNSAIKPHAPKLNIWIYDDKVEKMCMKRGFEMRSGKFCGAFENKF